jgi:hypothetical protein
MPGQINRIRVVAQFLELIDNGSPAPSAMPGAMHQNKCFRHFFS